MDLRCSRSAIDGRGIERSGKRRSRGWLGSVLSAGLKNGVQGAEAVGYTRGRIQVVDSIQTVMIP
jgi:hypothetical protein